MPNLFDLTWTDVDAMDRARTFAILPVGAVEAHGPHLPLGTDVVIGEAMALSGRRELGRRGVPAVVLPPILYTAAPFARGFPGTLSVRPETVTALIVDVARSLHGHVFGGLVLANAHLDPTHLRSLHAAVAAVEADLPDFTVIFPDVTRKPWALRLTDEFKSGACHAGRYEGSIVMASRPDLVREDVQERLVANPSSLVTAIRAGVDSFADAGGPQAYFGAPAEATAAEGEETIRRLGSILADAVADAPNLQD